MKSVCRNALGRERARRERDVVGRHVRAGERRLQHRVEHVARAPDRLALAADVEHFAVDADDHGDQRFERADVAVVMPVKAQMVVETDRARTSIRW